MQIPGGGRPELLQRHVGSKHTLESEGRRVMREVPVC
jgi:hypothetical protein